ncbi:MAG: serine/threonine protein kinase [Planctomycetes bacterium]|nr:serine/threonine protein kinase [Planctomycetota bacterium]
MPSKQEMMLMALAVKQGLIQKEQVQECLDLQAALKEAKGVDMPVVQIALKKKYLTPEQAANLGGGAVDIPGVGDSVSIDEARRIPIFEFERDVGAGGMAQVFLARNRNTGKKCAVKILYPKHTTNRKFVERFIREGRLLKEFDCPCIAKGQDYGVVDKDGPHPLYFMSMEFVDGPSIQDLLDRDGPFDEQKSIYVITEAAKGLAYMQERGVVHRDVKPDNIMWANDGRVLLVDLGFAAPIRKDLAGQYEDETCGTVQYISPEQAKGQADLDIRADIYSLGATLYHMVVGETPFTGKDSMEVMAKQVMEGLDAMKLKGGKTSVHMHYFIEKMMSKDRDFRYQSAREVVDDVTEVLQGAADLQYDPGKDPNSPFVLSGGRGGSTGRFSPVGHSTGRFAPIKGSGNTSIRTRPAADSSKSPAANSTSIRKPVVAPQKSTNRVTAPPAPAAAPAPPPVTPAPPPVAPAPPAAPGTSVRMPGAPAPGSGKSVRLPIPRKH